MSMLLRILKVLVCLHPGGHEYTRSIIMNYLVLKHNADKFSTLHEMVASNVGMLNEESGETTLANLGRQNLYTQSKTRVRLVNNKYSLLPIYRQVDREISGESKAPLCPSGYIRDLSTHTTQISAVAGYMQHIIHQAKFNMAEIYDGTSAGYKNIIGARQHQQKYPGSSSRIFMANCTELVTKQVEWVKANWIGIFWLQQNVDLWPEAARLIISDSDDVTISEGPDNDDAIDEQQPEPPVEDMQQIEIEPVQQGPCERALPCIPEEDRKIQHEDDSKHQLPELVRRRLQFGLTAPRDDPNLWDNPSYPFTPTHSDGDDETWSDPGGNFEEAFVRDAILNTPRKRRRVNTPSKYDGFVTDY